MRKSIYIGLIIIVVIGVAYFIIRKEAVAPIVTDTNLSERANVENYLRENISKLSPVKAVLGGTWYVTSTTVNLNNKSGTVTYEDGHIQESKNFSYIVNDNGGVASLTIGSTATLPSPVACSKDAKQCLDGSFVGRTGPNCEFVCPTPSTKSGITGTVILGPTCPVERIPPDPSCAPRFYATSINITKTGSTAVVKTIQSNANGVFNVDLNPGSYVLSAHSGSVLPRCGQVSVIVKSGQYTQTEISCDTGIR